MTDEAAQSYTPLGRSSDDVNLAITEDDEKILGDPPVDPVITIPVAEYEELLEIKAAQSGLFRFVIIKPARGQDRYVGWTTVAEGPCGIWTRDQALAEGCPPSRLRRADETGTSAKNGTYGWDTKHLIAEQRGLLPRENLLAYSGLLLAGRSQEAFDLLEPFEYETEVRRD